MGASLLVEFYNELPEVRPNARSAAKAKRQKALAKFEQHVRDRYTEGTLLRLLHSDDVRARRAATLALGLLGTMASNRDLATMLRHNDKQTRLLAVHALWSIWFRADSPENNQELQRLVSLSKSQDALAGLTALIKKAPRFAEAHNQRAIVYFRLEEYQKAIADCEKTLELNPYHFGAQSGMAQCYMKLRKPRQALKVFRNAYRLHPGLEGVEQTIRALEEALGEEGRMKDD